jgi:hypothetical protein
MEISFNIDNEKTINKGAYRSKILTMGFKLQMW